MRSLDGRHIASPLAKLAVFAAVTLLVTAVLAQTLGSLSFAAGTSYKARFTDVTGLLPGDDVRIAGVAVGRVDGIRLVDDSGAGGPVAEVTFQVDGDIPLATSVLAKVRYRNLVGQRYIALTEGAGGGERLRSGGVIPLEQTSPALDLTVLFNGFQPLFNALSPEDINKLAYEIVQVFQGEAGTVTSLIRHTASLTGTLAERDAAIGGIITNLNAVLSTLDEHDAELTQTIKQLQAFLSGAAGDRTAIGNAIVSIGALSTVTSGLLTESRPSLAADIDLLGQLAGNLNANSAVVANTLDNLGPRLEAIASTMNTGSWVNFYACQLTGPIRLDRNNDPQCAQ
jgi:phospholipid/cholesterol/gamma-HCH transport system substrate-binding protein